VRAVSRKVNFEGATLLRLFVPASSCPVSLGCQSKLEEQPTRQIEGADGECRWRVQRDAEQEVNFEGNQVVTLSEALSLYWPVPECKCFVL
jgi:hypothetical protein